MNTIASPPRALPIHLHFPIGANIARSIWPICSENRAFFIIGSSKLKRAEPESQPFGSPVLRSKARLGEASGVAWALDLDLLFLFYPLFRQWRSGL
jgi:hypothetical protein